jgi:hypothetical protein
VAYEHAVRVVQKLLDAGKQSWDFVTYPSGEHCFGDRPDYGADAFRRTFEMFERNLKPVPARHSAFFPPEPLSSAGPPPH